MIAPECESLETFLPDQGRDFCAFWATRGRIMRQARMSQSRPCTRLGGWQAALLAVLLRILRKALDGGDPLAFGRREDDDALGRPTGDTDAVDWAADQLPAV